MLLAELLLLNGASEDVSSARVAFPAVLTCYLAGSAGHDSLTLSRGPASNHGSIIDPKK